MDDLRTLGSVLSQDEPSQDVVDRSRHRLLNHMRGDRPVRTRAWLPIAAALTAVAAIAAVTLVALPSTSTEQPASGQDVLLAAATAAERTPEGSGAYWHLTIRFPSVEYPIGLECWTTPNGEAWYRNSGTEYAVWLSEAPPDTFALASGVNLTIDQLRALPTDPAALRAWVANAVVHGIERDKAQATLISLVSLVSTVPAPPEVRAAAFRVIAGYPGITNLGDVPGVLLPGDVRLVVDLAAGRVSSVSGIVVMGMEYVVTSSEEVTITAEWTDNPPS